MYRNDAHPSRVGSRGSVLGRTVLLAAAVLAPAAPAWGDPIIGPFQLCGLGVLWALLVLFGGLLFLRFHGRRR
jgi:hypothetical protein